MEKLGFFNSDLPHNVLSRLPTKTLLGLKCVSKGWHKIISERSFIQDQLQKHKPIISGFIFQGKYQWCNEDIKIVSYIPVESKVSQVQQMVFDFLPEVVVILASCNGLVCCRSCFPAQDPAIYVCNPSNKQWIRLNSATPDQHSTIGLVFDPARDPVNISTKFKLVRVKQLKIEEKEEEELYYTFEVYSLETGTWTKSNEICHCNSNLVKNKSVYVGGILHWQTNGDKVLTYHVENELSWLISVPVPATEFNTIPEACIGDSEGKLHYVMISEEGLHIWFLEDYFEIQWTLKYSKSLLEIEEEHPRFYNLHERVTQRVTYDMDPWMVPLAFKDGLLLMRVSAKLYLYHIETGMMKEACALAKLGPNSMYCPVVLPYSMSLVPLNRA